MDLLRGPWGLTGRDHLPLCLHTRPGNSGVHRGSCQASGEQQLDRKVFYLACRHHILESAGWCCMGESVWQGQSPENPWFKHFKNVWDRSYHRQPYNPVHQTKWLNKPRRKMQGNTTENPEVGEAPRADYREMAELTLIVLGDTPPRGIHWSRPGAIHQASVDGQKPVFYEVFMFAEQLEYDEETVVKLERLNLFLGLFLYTHVDVIIHLLQMLLQMICSS
ncbi:hypothetical protein GWK47_049629 [Chionoecetes opilio]|uniref:Uncharacterized protein n=1 Tax=Chionoecetes opilio TaxID=41210 RepID=A0A8J5CEZ1_CHIOP|nr:hypothetical protein GWK47_049629 [Chionoecetes opilio]